MVVFHALGHHVVLASVYELPATNGLKTIAYTSKPQTEARAHDRPTLCRARRGWQQGRAWLWRRVRVVRHDRRCHHVSGSFLACCCSGVKAARFVPCRFRLQRLLSLSVEVR